MDVVSDPSQRVPQPTALGYRCPGEPHEIDRSTHLGRLADFYPGCRTCVHRADAHTLPASVLGQWAEIDRRRGARPAFTSEAFAAGSLNEIDPSVMRQLAGALAICLWREHQRTAPPPAVLVGNDGAWSTAELVAAACEALQQGGCRTLEIGAVSSACLVTASHPFQADSAVWIGNVTGEPHSLAVKVFGAAGRPWSSPGDLDRLRGHYESKIDRPKRRGGGFQRVEAESSYLAPLRTLFHALRPLRLVLDTACEPLRAYLKQLSAEAACEVLPIAPSGALASETDPIVSFAERRRQVMARGVMTADAHFGMWIDGDGETCRAIDENGVAVPGERLFLALAKYILGEQPGVAFLLEREASGNTERVLRASGAHVVRSESLRQSMGEAMLRERAVFGGGPSGRLYFGGDPPLADALLALSLLLTILSQSDRGFSEVLDAAG